MKMRSREEMLEEYTHLGDNRATLKFGRPCQISNVNGVMKKYLEEV